MRTEFQKIINSYSHKYENIGTITVNKCAEVVRAIKNVTYIDSYSDKLENYNGFYIKINSLVLTIYVRRNGLNTGYNLQISITDKSQRRLTQIGGGYGTGGFIMTHEKYLFNEEVTMYANNETIQMLNELVDKFKKLTKL